MVRVIPVRVIPVPLLKNQTDWAVHGSFMDFSFKKIIGTVGGHLVGPTLSDLLISFYIKWRQMLLHYLLIIFFNQFQKRAIKTEPRTFTFIHSI